MGTTPRSALPVSRTARAILLVLLAFAVLVAVTRPVQATSLPSVKLMRASRHVHLTSYEGHLFLDLGVYLASSGGDFAVRAGHGQYGQPLKAHQVDDRGARLRELPPELFDGLDGFRDFLEIRFVDRRGRTVANRSITWCPNGGERQRVHDEGPRTTRYPTIPCSTHFPFRRGMVWGIDAGWAVNTASWDAADEQPWDVPEGTYNVRVRIGDAWAKALGVAAGQREVTLRATVTEERFEEPPGPEEPDEATPRPAATGGSSTGDRGSTTPGWSTQASPASGDRVPTGTNPSAEVLPDLVALPAWGMTVYTEGRRDLLGFAATPWNAGPGPFVMEGFRRSERDVMDAYQYFINRQGEAVGRSRAGQFEFHAGGGHDHWHFLQFAAFDLLDGSGQRVVRSHKQGFCLAPTDAVDLTRPGAATDPGQMGFTACGGPNALWIREVLAAGWGDTYFQTVTGQAFDITGVPNGRYQVRVRVDPDRLIQQRTRDNDVALRTVVLGGVRGERTVEVERWNGISEPALPHYGGEPPVEGRAQ